MARITAEDCRAVINNRFELVLLASHRAKELSKGAKSTIEKDNDKNAVISLREIANKSVDIEQLRFMCIQDLQKHANPDIIEDKNESSFAEETEAFEQTSALVIDNEAISVDNYIFEDEEEIEDDSKL
jgi:DNA-directed RNA polymerase subunit omega